MQDDDPAKKGAQNLPDEVVEALRQQHEDMMELARMTIAAEKHERENPRTSE